MNIYATGMNPVDANALKRAPRVAIFQAFGTIMQILKEKEVVNWRATRVGDYIPVDTDLVIVSMLLPRSLNCPYALGAIYAAQEALNRGIPLVLYMTDWAFFKAASEYRSIAKAGMPYFSKEIGGAKQYNEDPGMILQYGEKILEFCEWYGDPKSLLWRQAEVMVPRYTNWGNVKVIQDLLPGAHPVRTFDPTPALLDYLNVQEKSPSIESKSRAWLWPSLLKDRTWLDKQDLEWPVDRFGPKGFPVVEDERAVQQLYQERVGALCPPYPTAGSGWWRSRWIHSVLAGSILVCDIEDAWQAGDSYTSSGHMVELYNPSKLQLMANWQQEEMSGKLQRDKSLMYDQVYSTIRATGA